MSKERAQRRALREQQAQAERDHRQRLRQRRERREHTRSRLTRPLRDVRGAVSGAWQPISGGQKGLLARRRRRRFVSVTVIALSVNIAVAGWFSDPKLSLGMAAMTAVSVPVLARLLFSR